ncbi:phospholipid scramblase 1-like [Brevipalpus obovatus]|uniref:phospholipid scramblase 1-like n=1 Tax=Brevipalpus obovatus TaxID=246614 RepID=UPI003D9FA331
MGDAEKMKKGGGFQSYPKQSSIAKESIQSQSPMAQPESMKVATEGMKNYLPQVGTAAEKSGKRWIEQPNIKTEDPREKLAYLAGIDRFLINYIIEKPVGSCDAACRYRIKNGDGNLIFEAKEDASCYSFCGRSFTVLKILDQYNQEVIHLFRSEGCFTDKLLVSVLGLNIGSVQKACSVCRPTYKVYNPEGNLILRIEKLSGFCCTCEDIILDIFPPKGRAPIGQVHKIWPHLPREIFRSHHHLGISFPADLDVTVKAILLGACLFIDYKSFHGLTIFTPSENWSEYSSD